MSLLAKLKDTKMNVITNDRYFVVNDKPAVEGHENTVLIIQLLHDRAKGTTNILQCPCVWNEKNERYEITGFGHRQGEGALMYGTELGGKLRKIGVSNFDMVAGKVA